MQTVFTKENFHQWKNSGVNRRPVPEERVATREGNDAAENSGAGHKKNIISVELEARNMNSGSAH
jgi:hypothetical protein